MLLCPFSSLLPRRHGDTENSFHHQGTKAQEGIAWCLGVFVVHSLRCSLRASVSPWFTIYFWPKQYTVPSWLEITSLPEATAGEATKAPPASYSHSFLPVANSR